MTKLKIDLRAGLVEVEGEESFVLSIYNDFKEKLPPGRKGIQAGAQTDRPKPVVGSRRKVGSRLKESHSVVGDLDLVGPAKVGPLKDFLVSHPCKHAQEYNTVFVYYLAKAEIPGVSVDHVYTCYKHCGTRMPVALKQSLYDTANRTGNIDTARLDNITITTAGENFVEHVAARRPATKGTD
jgi:hypothetical protein